MVELSHDRVDGAFEIGKVHYPSGPVIDRTTNSDFSPEGVSVHPSALVPVWNVRQIVGGLEPEVLDELDGMHSGSLIRPASRRAAALVVDLLLWEIS